MSGSTWGGIVGGAIGYAIGGTQGAQIGFTAGSIIGGEIAPDVIKGPKIGDGQIQTSNEGVPRTIIYGTAPCAGNIVQRGELIHHTESERAGKGGPVQETDHVSMTFAVRICEGEIGGVLRIWQDDKLVADRRDPSEWPNDADNIIAMAADTAAFMSKCRIYTGSETQMPDPSLEALPAANGGGMGNVPTYRGSALAVLDAFDLTPTGGRIPQFRWEVSSCGDATPNWTAAPTWFVAAGSIGGGYALSRTGGTTYEETLGSTGQTHAYAHVVTGNHRVLLLDVNTGVCSKDSGDVWTPLVGLPDDTITGGLFAMDASQKSGVFILYHNAGIVSRSYDGTHFDHDTFPELGNIAAMVQCKTNVFGQVSTQLIAFGYQTSLSFDQAVSWSDPGEDWLFDSSNYATCAAADGPIAMVGGTNNKLSVTFNSGGSFLPVTSPFTDEEDASAAISDVIFNGFLWVVRNELGKVAYGSPGNLVVVEGFTLLPAGPNTGHGEGGLTVLGGDEGELALTRDGHTWEFVENPYATASASILGISGPGPLYGFAVPDVPDWIVTDDGTLEGTPSSAVSACSAELSDILSDICERVGLRSDQIDVSLATNEVRGLALAQQMRGLDAIRSCQTAFFGEFPESDLKLRWVPRGGASVVDITDDDFVDTQEDDDTRAQAVEFPLKINVAAADPNANYDLAVQTAARRTDNAKAVGELSVQLPFVMTRDEIAQVADKMEKIARTEAEGRWTRELPLKFVKHTPTDCFTHNGKRLRLVKSDTLDGSIKWEAKRDRASNYVSSATGSVGLPPTPPVSSLRGPTFLAAMNLPRLRSSDTVPGMYVGVCGILPGWPGAELQLSVDRGLTFQNVLRMKAEATIGHLAFPLGVSDEPMTVDLRPHGSLESITSAQLAARQNGFAITTAGVAEVGQFKTAEETDPNRYEVSELLRGQLGTTAATHVAGDQFMLLDAAVYFLPLDISLSGQVLIFRPVTLGTAPENNATYDVLYSPQLTAPPTVEAYTDGDGDAYTNDASVPYYKVI